MFDLADIESHRADGTAVTESGNEALAAEWSFDGGHLNADGAARAANAMWLCTHEFRTKCASGQKSFTPARWYRSRFKRTFCSLW